MATVTDYLMPADTAAGIAETPRYASETSLMPASCANCAGRLKGRCPSFTADGQRRQADDGRDR